MQGDARDLGDPGDHPVGVAAVDWLAGRRPQHQWAFGSFAAAGFQHSQHQDGEWHGGGLVALADQAQHPVAAQGLGVVSIRTAAASDARSGDPEQVGQGAVVDADGRGRPGETGSTRDDPVPGCGTRRGEPSAGARRRRGSETVRP